MRFFRYGQGSAFVGAIAIRFLQARSVAGAVVLLHRFELPKLLSYFFEDLLA